MSEGTTESYDEQLGIVLVAQHLYIGYWNIGNLLCPQLTHDIVVFRLGRDSACLSVLLQTTEDMCISFLSRHCPIAHLSFGIALVWSVIAFLLGSDIMRFDGVETLYCRQFPCSRTVCNEGIGEQDDRSEVLNRNLRSLICCVKTSGRTQGGNNWHWALTVSSVESLQEVGLLTLGGK